MGFSNREYGALMSVVAALGAVAAVVVFSDGGRSQGSLRVELAIEDAALASVEADPAPVDMPALFATHCATCHGADGAGNGPAAYLLFPKPRDFTSGVFRFRSTLGSAPPTTGDVIRTIRTGIPRTGMPGFEGVLNAAQITALADYVLAFSVDPTATAGATPEPITIPERPEFSPSLVEQGRFTYNAMGCAQCHGETGKGDGLSSFDLVDSNGYPLPPADFTAGVFKSGETFEDLYRTIVVGVPGTPMPSFKSAIDAGIPIDGVHPATDMVWAMVAYIESLKQPREREGARAGGVIPVECAADEQLLVDPFSDGWERVTPVAVAVQPLWQRRNAIRAVEVRAVVIDGMVAICLEWPDTTFNADETMSKSTDAVALMFSLSNEPITLTMGLLNVASSDSLVNLWHWKASRQVDAEQGRRDDGVDELVPGSPADIYPFKSGDSIAGPIVEHDKTFITAWVADNANADPGLMLRPILESNAAGFGTLTQQPKEQQAVSGRGAWAGGVWRAVFVRERASSGEDDVDLTVTRVPFCVAVWDGDESDRNGSKLVSGWNWLEIKP